MDVIRTSIFYSALHTHINGCNHSDYCIDIVVTLQNIVNFVSSENNLSVAIHSVTDMDNTLSAESLFIHKR